MPTSKTIHNKEPDTFSFIEAGTFAIALTLLSALAVLGISLAVSFLA